MNRSLLEKVQYLLSTASLDKTFWVETLVYASHLMNCLLSTTIGGKTTLNIWSGGVAQDYSLLRVFECPTYFSVKDDKLNTSKEVCVFERQKKLEKLQVMTLWKQEDRVEHVCHIWWGFIVETCQLSAGAEKDNQ